MRSFVVTLKPQARRQKILFFMGKVKKIREFSDCGSLLYQVLYTCLFLPSASICPISSFEVYRSDLFARLGLFGTIYQKIKLRFVAALDWKMYLRLPTAVLFFPSCLSEYAGGRTFWWYERKCLRSVGTTWLCLALMLALPAVWAIGRLRL